MKDLYLIIPFAPLAGAIVAGLGARWVGRTGAHSVTIFGVLLSFLAACVVFASLYGKSPAGNTYDYYGAVDKASAAYLQQVAWDTVQKFYGR